MIAIASLASIYRAIDTECPNTDPLHVYSDNAASDLYRKIDAIYGDMTHDEFLVVDAEAQREVRRQRKVSTKVRQLDRKAARATKRFAQSLSFEG